MKRNIIYVFLSFLALFLLSCKEEFLTDEIGEGESQVSSVIEFVSPVSALSNSRSQTGGAMDVIKNIWVLLYDAEENLVESHMLSENDFKLNGKTATFSLTVSYGYYYIYAAVNVGNIDDYAEQIKTVNGLKNITFNWNTDDVSANSQMFGHFVCPECGDGKTGPLLTVNRKNMSLRAEVRRAASKVTVAYDGSLLAEGVFVYIQSVQIKDIPSSCSLGTENKVSDKQGLIENGDTIAYFAPDEDYENWEVRIAAGHKFYPNDGDPEKLSENAHSDSQKALFFYENMQGKGKNKAQDKSHMGDNSIYKDDKPFGTYIEVKGYYRSINSDKVGRGPITYRFMLGKDVEDDYNAERNHHYKLTLRFNKFANDADWHIDYKEVPPSIIAPDEYYISYLYNRTMNMPIKINTGGGELISLKTRIITNNWAPYDNDLVYASDYDYDVHPDKPKLNCPWNGFLSLRKTKYTIIDNQKEDNPDGGIHKITDNKTYYTDPSRNLGERDYDVTPGKHSDENDGDYSLRYNDDNTVDIQLPFYTRAKNLIISTGYTGNNPYVAYRRRATVEISAELKVSDSETKLLKDTCEIFQMRRIVNPKGIYRSHDNITPFHVNLKVLLKENAVNFVSLSSLGTWKAKVMLEEGDFVTLDGAKEVSGSSGSQIDFTVGFTSTCRATESRCAIICVDYNNGSCQHFILVRQGYAPIQMISGGAKWHTFNLLSKDSEVKAPCDEGSLFRYGNLEQPIASSNQKNKRNPWIHVQPGDFSSDADKDFTIVGGNPSKWSGITYDKLSVAEPGWIKNLGLSDSRIARFEDYHALFIDGNIEFNYGVLYGDSATETATHINDVYGYRSGEEKGRGMRGCFVYNVVTGKNLFFPIGASGYGRRRGVDKDWSGSFTNNAKCVHRYGSRTNFYPNPGLADRPLFYDLFMRPGAMYWFEKLVPEYNGTKNCNALDINYFTFDFNAVSNGINEEESDACFIRCVDK